MDQRLMFWIRFAVGILFFWVCLELCDRIGGLFFLRSVTQTGYGVNVPGEVWVAGRELIQAVVAVGAAVLAVGWTFLQAWVTTLWQQKTDNEKPVPHPNEPNALQEILKRLRNLRK